MDSELKAIFDRCRVAYHDPNVHFGMFVLMNDGPRSVTQEEYKLLDDYVFFKTGERGDVHLFLKKYFKENNNITTHLL